MATPRSFGLRVLRDLYVHGLVDSELPDALFPLSGFFKTGAEAANLLESENPLVVKYSLSAESEILAQAKASNLPPCLSGFQNCRAPVAEMLQAMTGAEIATSIHLHKVDLVFQDAEMKWQVTTTEKACLKASVEEPSENAGTFPPTEMSRLSVYVDLSKLSKIFFVFKLEYDPEANKFKGMLPWGCLKQPSRLGKDVVSKL